MKGGSSSPGAPAPAPAPDVVDRVIRAIDAVSTAAGWLAGWLIVPMTVAVAYEVAARYVFNAPTTWAYDATYMLYGAQFMLAAAYTLFKGGHVRTDVFYERWSAKTRASVDAVSYVVFFFPGLLFILYAGAVEALFAWEIGERAGSWKVGSGTWPIPVYPLKAVIPLTAALLLLQGLSELIRCVRIIRGSPR
jgi:TRAP-type mannitol/chloroaromatic compound transport system permease small subunit